MDRDGRGGALGTEGEGAILEIRDLEVSFGTYGGRVQAVRGVSLDIRAGECLAVVGESGCGKSVTAQAVMRLLPSPPARISGTVRFLGEDLLPLPERKMRRIRGCDMGMIFQDPMTSLDPTMTVERQIVEALREHRRVSRREARERALELLRLVQIPQPERRLACYPHEFSGGMRQRVVIAMAVVCSPRLLIADEPTTALDVTTQAQILDLMRDLQRKLGTSVLLITHDMGVVAGMADRVAVLYAGRVAEEGDVGTIFASPSHPYTEALLRSRPRPEEEPRTRLTSIPGTPPDLFAPPPGCGFAPRCDRALRVCHRFAPPFVEIAPGHRAACWLRDPRAAGAAETGRKEARA